MRRVDPKVYTSKYYLTDCTGYNEFRESYGDELEIRFKELLPIFSNYKHTKVLDVGCGRGEIVYFFAKQGLDSYGIDYSHDAIKLANTLKKKKDKSVQQNMHFLKMDAKKLEFPNAFFSTIILTDVVEHLYPEELEIVFKELHRVLAKKGVIIVHTAPNKFFNDIGYKYYSYPLSTLIVKLWNVIFNKQYPNIAHPKTLRTDSHAIMHINEPTYFSLKKIYKNSRFKDKTFSSNVTARKPIISYKDVFMNLIIFMHPLSKHFPLNVFLGSDFVSILTKK